jgi:hypothetical protein
MRIIGMVSTKEASEPQRGCCLLSVGETGRRHEMRLDQRTAVGGVVSATQTPLVTGRRRALVIPDRPRAIDRYIDYFGGVAGPAAPWSGATPDRRYGAGSSGRFGTAERVVGGTVRERRWGPSAGREGPGGASNPWAALPHLKGQMKREAIVERSAVRVAECRSTRHTRDFGRPTPAAGQA